MKEVTVNEIEALRLGSDIFGPGEAEMLKWVLF